MTWGGYYEDIVERMHDAQSELEALKNPETNYREEKVEHLIPVFEGIINKLSALLEEAKVNRDDIDRESEIEELRRSASKASLLDSQLRSLKSDYSLKVEQERSLYAKLLKLNDNLRQSKNQYDDLVVACDQIKRENSVLRNRIDDALKRGRTRVKGKICFIDKDKRYGAILYEGRTYKFSDKNMENEKHFISLNRGCSVTFLISRNSSNDQKGAARSVKK